MSCDGEFGCAGVLLIGLFAYWIGNEEGKRGEYTRGYESAKREIIMVQASQPTSLVRDANSRTSDANNLIYRVEQDSNSGR
jgi:hypothetical protein